MSTPKVILRQWTGRIRSTQRDEYVDYIFRTGLQDYASTPGNLGYQMLVRELAGGECEVTTLSWWTSMEAVRGFAGPNPELAHYYPEDDQYLLERPLHVEHHSVFASQVQVSVEFKGD